MNREQLLTELESLFDLPADSLRGDQQLQDIPAWDSVAVLGVISLADEINGRLAHQRFVPPSVALEPGAVVVRCEFCEKGEGVVGEHGGPPGPKLAA